MSEDITEIMFNDFINGKESALTEIIVVYNRKLEAFVTRITKNSQQAEEIALDSFMKLWQNRGIIKSRHTLQSYLFKSALNASIDFHRRKQRENAYIEHEKHTGNYLLEIESTYDADVLFLWLEAKMAKMPSQRRIVFEMSRKEGYSAQEIANILGISHKTVRKHLELAIADLRKIMIPLFLLFLGVCLKIIQ